MSVGIITDRRLLRTRSTSNHMILLKTFIGIFAATVAPILGVLDYSFEITPSVESRTGTRNAQR